jgi:hypothetical protein
VATLPFVRVIEDSFDYRQARVTESLARDLAVLYVGELATLWKREFKNLAVSRKQQLKDSTISRLRRQHRIMGQKILNFVFNVSRRALLAFEGKINTFAQRDGVAEADPLKQLNDRRASAIGGWSAVQTGLASPARDPVGMNTLLALVLYNTTISSYNQLEPYYEELDDAGAVGGEGQASESDGFLDSAAEKSINRERSASE